jgi:hypothetical protein
MKAQNPTRASGFILTADQGQPFWFLNTLTITKVASGHSRGQVSILDHPRVPGLIPRAGRAAGRG